MRRIALDLILPYVVGWAGASAQLLAVSWIASAAASTTTSVTLFVGAQSTVLCVRQLTTPSDDNHAPDITTLCATLCHPSHNLTLVFQEVAEHNLGGYQFFNNIYNMGRFGEVCGTTIRARRTSPARHPI